MLIGLNLRRNISVVIFLAFIFRLAFVNIFMYTSTDASPNSKIAAAHAPAIVLKKRSWDTEEVAKSRFEICPTIEDEENYDIGETLVKTPAPVILSSLYSFVERIITSRRTANPFDTIKCNLYPRKYLALSVLRV